MFWLYFVREFYRATQLTAQRPVFAVVATVAYSETIRHSAPVAAAAPSQPAAAEAPISQSPLPTPHLPEPIDSMAAYLQRLSIEGDHAFGIWDTVAGFSIFSANFERVTGLATGECAGHDWIHTVHADQQYALNEALLNAQRGTDGRCLVQACGRYGEESWRWLLVDIKAPSIRQPHTLVLWRDLSEHKALEETIKQMEASLALSDRGRSAFLSSMSHELRTPLNAIMGFSEMMKSGVFGPIENPTYQQYVGHIHDSGATLLGKINDLLDIASMDAGGLELEETEFDLSHLLAEVIEIHSHHAFARNQSIKLDCARDITLLADRAKLLCSASHLVANALRHSQEGAEITVSTRIQPDDGLILSVRDMGEGIAAPQLEIIRGALEAEVAYFNIESGGIGLGLSLAKELTARHGGRVMIDSLRHRGTVVSLILPTSRIMSGLPASKKKRSPSMRNFELISS